MADVRLEAVTRRFGDTTAVDGLTLTVGDGELVALLGPTGAGKTTTLRLVAGLEPADAGRILIDGVDHTASAPRERDVAFVFQQYSLYPHMTVRENLAFPLKAPGRALPPDEIARRVEAIAAMLHIDHKLANKATQLSGGEMQRVAIGRALVRQPSIYLMDEPLSSLDAKLRAELRLELKRIQRDMGATILYVTHDQIEAMTMADRIGILSEGALVQVGTPREIYETPRNQYVATRLGSPAINLLPASLFPDGWLPPGTRTVGARTEHLRVVVAGSGAGPGPASPVPGRVSRVEHLGDQNHMHIDVAGHAVVVLVDPGSAAEPGTAVSLFLENPLYFGADGERLAVPSQPLTSKEAANA